MTQKKFKKKMVNIKEVTNGCNILFPSSIWICLLVAIGIWIVNSILLQFHLPIEGCFIILYLRKCQISRKTSCSETLRLCLVGVKIKRMENRREKIKEIFGGNGVWLEWFWRRENGGTYLFSPMAHHFLAPPNWRENEKGKWFN